MTQPEDSRKRKQLHEVIPVCNKKQKLASVQNNHIHSLFMRRTLHIWIEHQGVVYKFRHAFTSSPVLIAHIIYPADLFVMFQHYADHLGLDWDMDLYEMHLCQLQRKQRRDRSPPQKVDDDGNSLDHLVLEDQLRIDELDTKQLREMLLELASRDWDDVIFIKEVSTAVSQELHEDQKLWEALEGLSSLALLD
ncbi:hypothetical protein G7054_g15216 [Neopestalotiopsis clavispora]|nr:hypothetical protein G7054_g15216 [Neopestalotiopsis clavispora]